MPSKKHLAIFVHGWGAAEPEWWGTTTAALKSFGHVNEIKCFFHQYHTTHSPQWKVVQRIREIFCNVARHQELGELGQDLWSNVRSQFRRTDSRSISIFGHSFGGLVVADAISYAAQRAADGSDEDARTLGALTGVALCCSPMDGAKLAQNYSSIMKPVAKNIHVQNLLKDSKKREEVLNSFINYISQKPYFLTLFRADGDGIVGSKDIYGPFVRAEVKFYEDVLEGTHSDCVQNIGPATKTSNFEKIKQWLLSNASSGQPWHPSNPAPESRFAKFGVIRLELNSEAWYEVREGEEFEKGKKEFKRHWEIAADPVFDLTVENNSDRTLTLYRVGICLLQRKGGFGGNTRGYGQTVEVQSEFIVECPPRWKQAWGVLNDRRWTEFVDPIAMKKDDDPFRFKLMLRNFCDTDSASFSQVLFYVETSNGTVESKSIWLSQ